MKLKKIIASLGMAFVLMAGCITVQAVNVVQVPAEEIDTVYNQSIQSNDIEGWAKGPQIYSEAGIVMDIDSGAVLYAKNIDNPHYPASITKILTALVALENSELTDTVTVKEEDVEFIKKGDNHIGLKVGEEITMEDALYGTLLASGNEVAHAVASSLEGGYDNFLIMMNEKVKALGCKNSNFTNTHGLHEDNHYTSARDMALIGAEAFKNPDFRRITGTLQYTIPVTNITNETRTFQQHHRMLFDYRSQYYEYCVGGKTGYTDDALNTLVTFATKDDVNLVAVVLRTHGSGNTYVDTKAMLDYVFENFTKIPVTQSMVNVKGLDAINEKAYVMLPEGITFDDLEVNVEMPTEVGVMTGFAEYSYEGTVVGKVGFTITKEYHDDLHGIEEPKEEKQKKEEGEPVIIIVLKVILAIFLIIVLLFLLLVAYAIYKRKQRRKRRAEMRRRKREMEYRRYVRQMHDQDK